MSVLKFASKFTLKSVPCAPLTIRSFSASAELPTRPLFLQVGDGKFINPKNIAHVTFMKDAVEIVTIESTGFSGSSLWFSNNNRNVHKIDKNSSYHDKVYSFCKLQSE